jgi:hypothetical protein
MNARYMNTPQSAAVETAGTLGLMEMLKNLRGKLPSGGPKITGDLAGAAKNAPRLAGSPGFMKTASGMLLNPRVGGSLAGLAVLGSALGAAQEFDGEDVGLDASQASGRFLGDLGTTGGLAVLGGVLGGPVGAVALPAAAGFFGVQDQIGQAGANIGGGIYSALTGIMGESQEEKDNRIKFDNAMNDAKILKAKTEMLAPVQQKLLELEAQRNLKYLEGVGQVQSRYNYRNSLDSQALMNSQNVANMANVASMNLV